MSHKSYQTLWTDTQQRLQLILSEDAAEEKILPKNFNKIAILYLKYIKIAKCLERCYDQLVHPQQIFTIQKILEAVLGRILQLKSDMVGIEHRDFHFLDNLQMTFRMTPEDLELPVPKWYLSPEEKEFKMVYRNILDESHKKNENIKERVDDILGSIDDVLILIQRHERARQDREIIKDMLMQSVSDEQIFTSMDKNDAALVIQKTWRRYHMRKQYINELLMERRLLGMVPPIPPVDPKETSGYQALQNAQQRYKIREENFEIYERALVSVKEQLQLYDSGDIKEKLQDAIRAWYNQYREETGNFPDFPTEEEGGSNAIFNPELAAQLELKRQKEIKGKKEGERQKQEEVNRPKETKKKKEKEKQEEEKDTGNVPACIPHISEGCYEYEVLWKNFDESKDHYQRHEDNLIKQQKLSEVKEEIRIQVDQLMREELQLLQKALAKDRGKKYKPKREKKYKKRDRKKGKKDITANRSLESLYNELVDNSIIKKYNPSSLDDFLGDYNYIGSNLTRQGVEPIWHYPSDIKHVVLNYCILPLSNAKIHEVAPLIKSVLFVGPPGVGKKLLVNSICSLSHATMFDLSPANVVGKYPGKAGLKMLMHLVSKVGRAVQPSVIVINDAEKAFMNKVPKTDKTEPKRLKKGLLKFLKEIKTTDRLLVCGISSLPFNANDMKGLNNTYQKIIYVPHPGYGSRQILWKNFIMQAKGEITPLLCLTVLSKISDGYTGKQIKQVVLEVLTERRIRMLKQVPFSVIEFIDVLSQYIPLYKAEIEAYKTWFGKTNLAKKRWKMLNPHEKEKEKRKK